MKTVGFKILILAVVLLSYINRQTFAQTYGDKDYFLIDSLNVDDLSEADKNILNQALNKFHNAKHDSLKIEVLEVITENLMDDAWVKYNLLVKKIAEKNLLLPLSETFIKWKGNLEQVDDVCIIGIRI